jgi:hypothetical protein
MHRARGSSLVASGARCRGIAALAVALLLAAFAALGWTLPAPVGAQATAEDPAPITSVGFLRDERGRFRSIVPPGAAATKPGGLNNRGELVGVGYPDLVGPFGGFGYLRDRRGRYEVIDAPGKESRTVALDLNDRGQVVGFSDDGLTARGFLRDSDGDFTAIEHPDAAGATAVGAGTNVVAINNRGELVGNYVAGGTIHGFLRNRKGRFRTIDRPGAAATYLTGINDAGNIVGQASDVGPEDLRIGSGGRGFVLRQGVYSEIAVPGATVTGPNAINNRGQIAGSYADPRGTLHGFVRTRRGDYRTIDHPDATPGTAVQDINDRGQLAGAYETPAGEPPKRRPTPLGMAEEGWGPELLP